MNEQPTEAGVPEPPSPRRSRPRELALAVILVLLGVRLALPGGRAGRTVDLRDSGELQGSGVARSVTVARATALRIPPWKASLSEDGRPLLWVASPETVATLGSGRFATLGREVAFSATDGSDPATNGRRYELTFEADRIELVRSLPTLGLALVAAALLLDGVRRGTIALLGASSRRSRVALVAGASCVLLLGAVEHRHDVAFNHDSGSYLSHATSRPILYPTFLDLCDREPGTPREAPARTERPRTDPENRWLRVAQAQKLAVVAAIAALVWALSSAINVWQLAALLGFAVFVDTEHLGGDSSVWWNVTAVMSEGLNHALVFGLLAALFASLERPSALLAATLGFTIALLFLNRPANVALAGAALVAVWGDATRSGWRPAARRTAWLAVAAGVPLALACGWTWHVHGRFRLHAFTGPSILAFGIQVGTPEDVATFDDPRVRALARTCLVELGDRRVADFHTEPRGEYVNRNLYEIALPALERTLVVPPGEDRDYLADDVSAALARGLIARHPRAYAELAAFQLKPFFDPVLQPLEALAALVAFALWRRTRAPRALYALAWALLPVVYMTPTFLFNVPLERYRSQVYGVEYLALPLVLAVWLSLPRRSVAR